MLIIIITFIGSTKVQNLFRMVFELKFNQNSMISYNTVGPRYSQPLYCQFSILSTDYKSLFSHALTIMLKIHFIVNFSIVNFSILSTSFSGPVNSITASL